MTAPHAWYFETDTAEDALAARHLLEHYLSDHCEEVDLYAASLVFGELVSNVIKHAPGGGVRVWLEPSGERYALCIKDGGEGFEEPQRYALPEPDSESGRGLFLVHEMACHLEYRRSDGFVICAVLPVTRKHTGGNVNGRTHNGETTSPFEVKTPS